MGVRQTDPPKVFCGLLQVLVASPHAVTGLWFEDLTNLLSIYDEITVLF